MNEPHAAPLTAHIDADHFRKVLGHFATGITIVTARDAHGPVGLTAQSFSSLSLDPPLVLVCPSKSSTSWPRIEAVGRFCVNVLSEDQEELCRGFARSGVDKFAGVGHQDSPTTGAPLLDGVLAWVDCVLGAVHDGGDHLIVVGRVLDLGFEGGADAESGGGGTPRPLLFFRGSFGRFAG